MNTNIKQRVFIVGCPRSGTTFLQTLLLQHSTIISFPESHFFTRSLLYPKFYKRARASFLTLKDWNKTLREGGYQYNPIKFSIFTTSYVKQFINSLDINAIYNNKTIWIEKTPSHLSTIKIIQKNIPDAKFIHLIRNGEDVVASLFEVTNQYPDIWNKSYSFKQALERYNHDILVSKQYKDNKNHIFIKYESLINSLDSVKEIYDFLSLDAPNEIKLLPNEKIIRKEEKWKSNNHSSNIINTRGKKFKKIFTILEQEYIRDNLIDTSDLFEGLR